jgi:DNA-binding beta-propeller fold protein YncE
MRKLALTLMAAVGMGWLSAPAFLQEKGGNDATGQYEVVANWPKSWAPPGYTWGSHSGVAVESPNRIFLAVRGVIKLPDTLPPTFTGNWGSLNQGTAASAKFELRDTIVVVDGQGNLLESWKQWDSLYQYAGGRGPHKLRIDPYDPEKHLWVVDDKGQVIRKFTNDGKTIVLTLGEQNVTGTDEKHFGEPTDVAFLPDGTIFVADGYKNTRVVKFDKTGKYLSQWGTRGTDPGQFSLVHGIAVDANRRVYVCDRPVLGEGTERRYGRIQVFDENGQFLDQWGGLPEPNDIVIDRNQHAWVADGTVFKIIEFDLNGKLLYSWGTKASFPGAIWEPHELAVDSEGSLYIADSFEGRAQKYRPRRGADMSKIVAQPSIVPLRN